MGEILAANRTVIIVGIINLICLTFFDSFTLKGLFGLKEHLNCFTIGNLIRSSKAQTIFKVSFLIILHFPSEISSKFIFFFDYAEKIDALSSYFSMEF
jgi:hypothetical protein